MLMRPSFSIVTGIVAAVGMFAAGVARAEEPQRQLMPTSISPAGGESVEESGERGNSCAPAGTDCWTTQCDGATHFDFAQFPLPPDFFFRGPLRSSGT